MPGSDRSISWSLDYEAVVKLSEGFNGADLRNICTEAGMFAIRYVASSHSALLRGPQLKKEVSNCTATNEITVFKMISSRELERCKRPRSMVSSPALLSAFLMVTDVVSSTRTETILEYDGV